MESELPLEVTALMAPILSWVEGTPRNQAGQRPGQAQKGHGRIEREERLWLMNQLPTASLDKLDEIVQFARPRPAENLREHRRHRPKLSDLIRSGSPFREGKAPELAPPEEYRLAPAFRQLARRFLIWDGAKVAIREGRIEELHELSLRFPVGHLIRHYQVGLIVGGLIGETQALALPSKASHLPTASYGLEALVTRGISEGHLHLKGITNADDRWCQGLMQHQSFLISNVDQWLFLGACGARILALAVLLAQSRSARIAYPLELLSLLDAVYFARTPDESLERRRLLLRALHQTQRSLPDYLLDAHRDARIEYRQHLEAWLDPKAMRPEERSFSARLRACERLHLKAHQLLLEPRTALQPTASLFLEWALFRYIILRTHHWQRATQSGRTTGFSYFRKYFSSPSRRPKLRPGDYERLVMKRLRGWQGLRVLEGRLSPPERVSRDLLPWIVACANEVHQNHLKKFGIIVHFIKEKPKQEKGLRELGLPVTLFGTVRRRVRRQSMQLYRLLSRSNVVAPFIVGIDAANIELAARPEVFAPAFRFLRELPIRRRQEGSPFADRFGVRAAVDEICESRRLGMTFHVGEDFRHLLSGLRAIYEVIEFLKPRPGDRLGHAIALALQPKVWAKESGYQAVLPKLEWLDTLVWVHHLLGPGHNLMGELGIEDTIQRLSWEIYGPAGRLEGQQRKPDLERDWSPLTLFDAWRLRQLDPDSLDKSRLAKLELVLRTHQPSEQEQRWLTIQQQVLDEVSRHIGSRNAYRLLEHYWYNQDVRRRGEEPILIDMRDQLGRWLDLCEDVEDRLLKRVQKEQIVVEVNPAANRFIGPMSRLDQHHIFRMTLDEKRRLHRKIRVTINTDNPAVFHTSLAHQYYLLGEILIRQGEPEGEVMEWLEWLRRNGEDYSFVRQLPKAKDRAMESILKRLSEDLCWSSLPQDSDNDKLLRFWKRFASGIR